MSMTTEERKAWAVGLIDRWQRQGMEEEIRNELVVIEMAADDLAAEGVATNDLTDAVAVISTRLSELLAS